MRSGDSVRKFWLVLAAVGVSATLVAAELPTAKVNASLGVLPRGFVANSGQWDSRAAWAAPGFFGTTWVTRDGELRHVLLKREDGGHGRDTEGPNALARRGKPGPSRAWVLSERFAGGTVHEMQGQAPMGTQVSYFHGSDPARHRAGLESYGRLSLGEVWPGVAVSLKAGQRTVEKIFEVKPSADPSVIRIALQGAQTLSLNDRGELVVGTGYGDVVLSRPVAWQEADGARKPVQVSYHLDKNAKTYGFVLGPYDRTKPLTIDPILQSTYLGGSDYEYAYFALAIAGSGEVYVAGSTDSTDFPGTAGGVQTGSAGSSDAFVAQLNSDLTSLLHATYLGGSDDDKVLDLALGGSGEVYVAGWTVSTDFPGTSGGAQASNAGHGDAFVARLNSDLTSLTRSTYLGGTDADQAYALALAGSGEVYVAGYTASTDFPGTSGGAQPHYAGNSDAFVARLNSDLTSLVQSTYLGGSLYDYAFALALAGSGEVYVAGYTASTDFPGTLGGAQPSYAGGYDPFVARLNSGLTSLVQATYLGGSDADQAYALALAGGGDVYVAGYTASTDFPGTSGGAQPGYAGGSDDAFVAQLNADLTHLLHATYLGGSDDDQLYALGLTGSGEVYVAGYTASTDFPGTSGGAQASNAGGLDAFVARLTTDLTTLTQSTYLGGSDDDYAPALALAGSEVYVAGFTSSTDFPGTANGAQAGNAGNSDAFVTRLTADLAATAEADMVANAFTVPSAFGPGQSVSGLSFSCTNNGPSAATNAACSMAVSAGTVSGVSCTPAAPVASLASGASITCTYTFTAPGTQGGGDTPETGVTFTVTSSSATTDPDTTNNTATSGATPIPIVDALDDAVTLPAGTTGATFDAGSNDQDGTGSLPGTASFTLESGTTCGNASIDSSGMATFDVLASGTCTVAYQVCVDSGCDTATLAVTAQRAEPIPTLENWGLWTLIVLLAGAGVLVLRRILA